MMNWKVEEAFVAYTGIYVERLRKTGVWMAAL
jgi:hypothetical protein